MYYQGDYYRGDWYRGDPGLFDFLGKVAKTGLGFVGKALGATPLGAVATSLIPTFSKPSAGVPATMPGGGIQLPNPFGGFGGGYGMPTDQMGRPLPVIMPGMRRTHPNRSTYVTRGGGTSRWPRQLVVHPKGTEAVTSRRMNVGNARALRRSLRRARGFAKLAHRVLAATRQFKGKGFPHRRRRK